MAATLIAMSIIDRLGRKKLLLAGTAGLTVCLGAISTLFLTGKHLHWLVWLIIAYIACFATSQGAVIWVYISEVFPNRVRAKGQALGSSATWVANALISAVFPLMAKSYGAYPFLFFASMMALDFVVVLFWYPETSGVSLEQMQRRMGID
jgi:MFS family permease